MNRERGAVLPLLMGVMVALGALLFALGHSIFVHRDTQRRDVQIERAYYAAEAGIEAALGDLGAGRAPGGWASQSATADVSVTRRGRAVEIVSTGVAGAGKVTIRASVEKRDGHYAIASRSRGVSPDAPP